jgi:predicted PurR-regulated permease PerM
LLGLDRNAARYTWTAVLVLLLVGLLYLIRETLFIFFVALLFAYLLWPLVKLLDRWLPGRSKVLALTLVYLAIVGILIVMGIALGSRIVQQANTLAARLPDLLTRFQPPIAPAASHYALPLKMTVISTVQQQLTKHSQDILAWLSNAALGVMSRAGNLIFFILVPILSFFFLKDGREMLSSVVGILAAGARRDMVERIAADLHVLLAQYMRALVLLGVVASLTYGLFFSMVGVPYGILLAAVAFPLEFIPMVGPLAGAVIVLLVASLSGSHHLLAIFVFLLAFRFLQDYVVSPQLLSAGMKLHPLLVIFGVLAGGSIAGIAGCFLSVPGARCFANRLPAVVNQSPSRGGGPRWGCHSMKNLHPRTVLVGEDLRDLRAKKDNLC